MKTKLLSLWYIGLLAVLTLKTVDANHSPNLHPEPDPIETKNGPIRGRIVKSQRDESVSAYYGIPYAEPPIGNLRFSPPQKSKPWSLPLNATKPTLPCYQQFTEDTLKSKEARLAASRPWTENCLTINVFTPFLKPKNSPVVVFFHGGGFLVGNSLWWVDFTTLASKGIVVAAVNYRLGVFGFLSIGNDQVPGNAGLMDQQLAMQWVKDNIEAFGGDPEEVTILGCSAGSASVGFHLLAPGSRSLFKRAILMSGVPTNYWAVRESEYIITKSKLLMKVLGCSSDNEVSDLDCLRSKHPEDILDATLQPNLFSEENFIPIVDGQFLLEHPVVSAVSGRFNKADVLIGSVSDDAAAIMKSFICPEVFSTVDGRLYRRDFQRVIRKSQNGITELQARALDVVYINWSNPDDPLMLRDAAKDAFTDGMFACNINEFSEQLSRSGSRVFRYVYDHNLGFGKYIPGSKWMRATHGMDQMILIGPAELRFGEPPEDVQVREFMLKSVLQFINRGSPNSIDGDSLMWPQMSEAREYMLISSTPTVRNNYRFKECAVWLNLLPNLKENCIA